MFGFEETMASIKAQYQDVIDELTTAGLPTTFASVGGLNVGLEVRLDVGHVLLVTDAAGSLPSSRAEHDGWAVALFPSELGYSGEMVAGDASAVSSVAGLRALVDRLAPRYLRLGPTGRAGCPDHGGD